LRQQQLATETGAKILDVGRRERDLLAGKADCDNVTSATRYFCPQWRRRECGCYRSRSADETTAAEF
jgi:hypothetical protein